MTNERCKQAREAALQRLVPASKQAEFVRTFEIAVNWADEHQVNPWISLKEQKPPVKQRVLFLDNKGIPHIGYEQIDGESARVGTGNPNENITLTHWMPIPELRKED